MTGQLDCKRAWINIDEAALIHNVQQLRQRLAPQAELMAVVKANAYGHGAVTVARTVLEHGATRLAVATILEGKELREAGIKAPILLLGPVQAPEEVHAIATWQLQPTLTSPAQAQAVSEQLEYPLPVHLNIDTGMSRLGPNWQEGADFDQFATRLPHLESASVYSHLATADEVNQDFMHRQHHRFQKLIQQLYAQGFSGKFHFANSAGTLQGPQYHYDWVRVGLALYGLYPDPQFHAQIDLRPVMQVKARITQIKPLAADTGISYGHSFITAQPTTMAVVGIGYADGLPRPLSNRLEVLVRGQKVKQIGNITMDQIMIDISAVPQAQVGDVVTLIGADQGQNLTVDQWAEMLGTISYEIVCGFKPRLPRVLFE